MRSEWKATDQPWWPAGVLLVVVALAPVALEVIVEHRPIWSEWAFPLAALLAIVGAARGRLRLTEEGVEIRQLRTRVYRWSDIASVERAPAWSSRSVIWLRQHGSVASSAPEVLALPGFVGRAGKDEAIDEVVAHIRRRAHLD